MKTVVKVQGVDVTAYLSSYEIERMYGDAVAQLNIIFAIKVNNLIELSSGQEIEIWRGYATATEEKIFDGYVEKYEPDGGKIKLSAKDKLWDLVRKEITQLYDSSIDAFGGKISSIFSDMVETYGNLNVDATSVQDSGTVYVLPKFNCNHCDILERCQKLADILGWQFYYKPTTDLVYFEPKGQDINTGTFIVGDNIINLPKWTYDVTEMVNDVIVNGAYQEVETTETGTIGTTTGYTTSEIALTYTPLSVKVYINGALKVGGVAGSTASYDYEVDKGNKRLLPFAAFTTGDAVEVRYSLPLPVPTHEIDSNSVSLYGQFKKTVTYTDIRTVEESLNRASGILNKYAIPFISSVLKVRCASTNNFNVGQLISVTDNLSKPIVNSTFVINKYRLRWPADYDELEVGDKYWRLAEWNAKVMEKLKRGEEEEFANQDIIFEVQDIDNSTTPLALYRRYSSVTKSAALYWLQSGDNIYEEYFYDDDCKDASTTGTWDNTNQNLILSGTKIAVGKNIDYNNGTITQVQLDADDGDIVAWYKLNADSSDSSGNSFTGTDTAITYGAGKISNCASFNGTTSNISIADNAKLQLPKLSVACWFKSNGAQTGNPAFVVKGNYRNVNDYRRNYMLGISAAGDLTFQMTTGTDYMGKTGTSAGGLTTSGTDYIDGAWHHIVGTYDGYIMSLYVDGTLITSCVDIRVPVTNSDVLLLGTDPSGPYFWKGYLDDVRIYNYALTTTEIASIYNAGSGTESAVGSTTANLVYSVSADGGSHWETTTKGVVHAFTNTGTNLMWKASNTTTNAYINKIKLSKYHNTNNSIVTLSGRNIVLNRFIKSTPDYTIPNHFQIGTGTTLPSGTDEELVTPVVFDKAITTITIDELNMETKFEYSLTTAEGNGNTLTEFGIFNTDATPKMYSRTTFPALAKTASDSVIIVEKDKLR